MPTGGTVPGTASDADQTTFLTHTKWMWTSESMESKSDFKMKWTALKNKEQDAFMIFLNKWDYSRLYSFYV